MLKSCQFSEVFQNQVKLLMCDCFFTTSIQAELAVFFAYFDVFLLQRFSLWDSYIQNKFSYITKWKQYLKKNLDKYGYWYMHWVTQIYFLLIFIFLSYILS